MEKLLNDFIVGEKGIVKTILAVGPMKRRLFDMGVTPGTKIMMHKIAPLGDPLEITIRNYELTLRRSEASLIKMEVIL
ncbi:MAG: FeoA domain-containing protein [Erysipelotrichaceae bacterium]|jgi:Fe2+ transport system protein FeoA|nr:FeoA domain-containing protein [Erysipelotrichaceae bacterium]